MEKFDVIIIGSGLSGLLCASILSKEGFHVCILEKQDHFGGCFQNFKRNNISFDTGIHYTGSLSPGQPLYRYWKYFGLIDKLNLIQLDKDCFDMIGIEEHDFPLAQGFENFREQLLPHFPDSAKILSAYTDKLKEVAKAFPLYNLELPGGTSEDPFRSEGYENFLKNISSNAFHHSDTSDKNKSGIGNLASGISISSVLAGNNFIYSGHPLKTPLYIPAIINHSLISSAWRFVDGSAQVTDHLIASVQSEGGQIFAKEEVIKIIPQKKGFITSTGNTGDFVSDYVISSLHPATTLKLIDRSLFRNVFMERIAKLENSASAFTIYIVWKEKSFPYFNYNFYFHTKDNTWTGLINNDTWPDNYLLYTPACTGQDEFAKSAIILTTIDSSLFMKWENTITGDRGAGYAELKEKLAWKLINLAEKRFPGLRAKIHSMDISTPLDWRDYTGTPDGSMFGIQKAFNDPLRTSVNPRTKIPGFFLTGQNINFHGALGVTTGAVLTCGQILGMEYLIKKIEDA